MRACVCVCVCVCVRGRSVNVVHVRLRFRHAQHETKYWLIRTRGGGGGENACFLSNLKISKRVRKSFY